MHLKAFGKVNLYLDVISRRKDNYHNILTIFQSINEHDEIFIEFSKSEIFESEPPLTISWDKNIIKKAIETFKKETGLYDFNLKIKLIKNLPIGGGVGGGSADAAAVLGFLSNIFNIPEKDLFEISCKIGSDVPFLIKGGTAIGKGKGEILEFLEPLKLNIKIYPMNYNIDTKKMYEKIDQNWESINHFGDPYKLYDALKSNDIITAKQNAFNVFEQVVFKEYPKLKQKKEALEKDEGIIFALMSGSGSTIYKVISTN
ncbi:MAG TPA: 4-(cytidine 5'-diphospho)-2-C-methyl-D-erythritol kinase [Petrotoga sp.]|nr:4-(cytidine 5'-diphospho)-2-C-methyl-D-erythritol kinase [Petrotoga sp.]